MLCTMQPLYDHQVSVRECAQGSGDGREQLIISSRCGSSSRCGRNKSNDDDQCCTMNPRERRNSKNGGNMSDRRHQGGGKKKKKDLQSMLLELALKNENFHEHGRVQDEAGEQDFRCGASPLTVDTSTVASGSVDCSSQHNDGFMDDDHATNSTATTIAVEVEDRLQRQELFEPQYRRSQEEENEMRDLAVELGFLDPADNNDNSSSTNNNSESSSTGNTNNIRRPSCLRNTPSYISAIPASSSTTSASRFSRFAALGKNVQVLFSDPSVVILKRGTILRDADHPQHEQQRHHELILSTHGLIVARRSDRDCYWTSDGARVPLLVFEHAELYQQVRLLPPSNDGIVVICTDSSRFEFRGLSQHGHDDDDDDDDAIVDPVHVIQNDPDRDNHTGGRSCVGGGRDDSWWTALDTVLRLHRERQQKAAEAASSKRVRWSADLEDPPTKDVTTQPPSQPKRGVLNRLFRNLAAETMV